MAKVQVNKNIFYFELSSKSNVGILGITVSMQVKHEFKLSSLLIILSIFKIELARGLGLQKEHTLWGWILIFFLDEPIDHITPTYEPGKSKFEVDYYIQTYFSPKNSAHIFLTGKIRSRSNVFF